MNLTTIDGERTENEIADDLVQRIERLRTYWKSVGACCAFVIPPNLHRKELFIMHAVEPQVFLIGETRVVEEGLNAYL